MILDLARIENPAPDRVKPEALADILGTAAESNPATRAFGWFDSEVCPRGVLVGFVILDPYTGNRMGSEYFWYVQKDYRHLGIASELLEEFSKECRESGCTKIVCGLSVEENPRAMRRLYRRKGFKPHSEAFVKEI